MSNIKSPEGAGEGIGDEENCRLCGLLSFEVLLDKSADSLDKIENRPCFVKTVIAFLHEQILGCQENDKSTRPKVSLSRSNGFFQSLKYQDLKEQHNSFIKSPTNFTELTTYSVKPADKFKPVNIVNFKYVNIEKEFNAMMSDLLKCSEIGVNLEYYSTMSYLGFTWLLQISTAKTNYFVNCLNLETQMPDLNDVFMNSNILKIFYKGKDSILKLQKDFGIFTINIFDIHVIKTILEKPRYKKLLENFDIFSFVDPKHTYLLLYIKDYLTTLLSQKDHILRKLCIACKEICDQLYQKPEWNDMNVIQNLGSTRESCQEIYIVRKLLIWRDNTAKKEDVSLNFICPDNKILNCAREFLKNGYSETFDRYCKVDYLKKQSTELNIYEIVKIARTNSTKKFNIANSLGDSLVPVKPLQLSTPKSAQRKSNSQIPKQKCNLIKNNVSIAKSSIEKIPKQEITKEKKTLPIKVNVKKPNPLQLLRILKPQLRFKDRIDNICPIWKPGITEKPNGLVPLDLHIMKHGSKSRYCHPYKTELQHFCIPKSQLVENTPIPIRQIEETPLYFIETALDLRNLSSNLKSQNEIAVGLMYNKKRSYAGHTSLLLISTRDSDYIIDALALRAKLKILNNIFTDPKILKVFHNSANKLLWLQKDLSLYVVNMFDVARTDMAVNKKIVNLLHLKRHVCGGKFKKQVELPGDLKDWRVRSLSHKVKEYLRHDTHCLLYIKDILSNKLCSNGNFLKRYYDYCTTLCKNVYQKPSFKINCYKDILNKKYVKNKYAGHTVRIEVLKELNRLRHMIARSEDENPDDILSEEVLLKLVDLLPHDQQRILDFWNYDKKRKYISKVTSIIYTAKNIKFKSKLSDDYNCILELENDINETIKKEIRDEKETRYNNGRSVLKLGDFICSNKADETTADNFAFGGNISDEKKNSLPPHDLKTCFRLIKGHRWDHTRNIGDWLNKWIGQFWRGKYYVKETSDSNLLINVFFKKYKDIIWMKRDQIRYEEGVSIRNWLSPKDLETQKSLATIAKDKRNSGLQVKIRELAIKIEDKWYELKSNVGLQEISAETLRKRGVDTD